MTRSLLLAAATLVCAALAPMHARGAELCSAEPNTLLFDCDALCDATAKSKPPCMRSNASCAIECFPAAMQQDKVTKTNYFAFLIPFSAAAGPALNGSAANASANGSAAGGATISVSSLFAFKSNDELKKIAPLRLPATTVGAVFRGGPAMNETVKGRVVTVELAPDLLAKSRQVTSLELINLNLTAAAGPVLAKLTGSRLNKLSLSNGLLTEFPMNALKIKSLRTLVLSYNDITKLNDSMKSTTLAHLDLTANGITEIPKKTILAGIKGLVLSKNAITNVPADSARIGLLELHLNENKLTKYDATNKDLVYLDLSSNQLTEVPTTIGFHRKLKNLVLSGNKFTTFPTNWSIPSLQTLEVVGNQLTGFEAKLTSLTKLDLSGNKLKTIPSVIFTMTKLKTLLLANNSMQNVAFTKEQATFFVKLEQFAFDTSVRRTDCAAAAQMKIHNFTYCVVDTPVGGKTKGVAHVHHHHKHHQSHRQHHKHHHVEDDGDDGDDGVETSTGEPATVAAAEPPHQETTTALAAVDSAPAPAVVAAAAGTSGSEPNLVIIGLISAAVGFVAVALPVVVVALLRRQRRRVASMEHTEPNDSSESAAADESENEDEGEGESGAGVLGVTGGSDSGDDEATMVVSV